MLIDCDSHVFPKDAFDYVPAELREAAPTATFDEGGHLVGLDFPGAPPYVPGTTPLPAAGPSSGSRLDGDSDVDARLADLDRMGVDHQLLLPQFSGWWSYLIEPHLASAIAHSWNVAIGKVVERHPDRFSGVAIVALQDLESCLEELEWARSAGFVGVALDQTVPEADHPYGSTLATHREFWPVFAWCEAHGFPVVIHNVSHGHRLLNCPRFLSDGLDFFAISEPRMNLVAMITTGLLDRYPRLRIVQAESGTGYLPQLVEDLDQYFGGGYSVPYDADEATPAAVRGAAKARSSPERVGIAVEGVDRFVDPERLRPKNLRPPSTYFRENYYWTIETEERGLLDAIAVLGAERFLFATDYPHDDPGGRMKFRDRERLAGLDLSSSERALIGSENARLLFGCPRDAAPPCA
ncbi:MAG TPA: amidohydrolase family protein [Acidimicrobiales bacterium]|nr:amidohydrolase family protein [Acidimicrobiales bacterium]